MEKEFQMKSYGSKRWYLVLHLGIWKIDSAEIFLNGEMITQKPDKWWQKLSSWTEKVCNHAEMGKEIQWGASCLFLPLKTSFRVDGLKSWTIPPLFAGLFDTMEQIVNFVKIHDTYTLHAWSETYNDVLEILYQQTMNGKTGWQNVFVKGISQVEFW